MSVVDLAKSKCVSTQYYHAIRNFFYPTDIIVVMFGPSPIVVSRKNIIITKNSSKRHTPGVMRQVALVIISF